MVTAAAARAQPQAISPSEEALMSEAAALPAAAPHPVGLVVTDDLKRSRLTVFFRLLLAIPHFVWLELWGILAMVAVLIAWLVALFTGRVPDGLHTFIARYMRYTTHVYAYVLLLANPFPSFSGQADYPVDLRVEGPQRQGRVGVLFRVILAFPALLLTSVFRTVNELIAFLNWFYALFTGRMNGGMRDLSAWLLRYELQTYAYLFLLTSRYPSLAGAPAP
jgi:hypothetical protein